MIVNIMEHHVSEAYDRLKRMVAGFEDTPAHRDDVIVLALNRADSALGIRVSDVEQSIGRKIDYQIISDGRTVVYALNRGVPFVTSNREMQVSQDILKIARSLVGGSGGGPVQHAKVEKKRGIFSLR